MERPEHNLEPLPYHVELRDYLKSEERELWKWFSSAQTKAEFTEKLRVDLLKSTYRLDPEGHPELYLALNEAKAKLQLDIPVTLYQAQTNPQLNAMLLFVPGQGHVVFSGPALTLLNAEELKSVIGHELAHYHLWERDQGEFLTADRLVHAVANDPRSAACHEQTARRYELYTEIFADRGSLRVVSDAQTVVAGLVKMDTGLSQVSGASYLKQAEEIFSKGNVATEGVSHPESFIRARALALWQTQGESTSGEISKMIEGAVTLEDLDLLGQKRLTLATRRLLEHLLKPKWFQTPAALAHAKMFFEDFRQGLDGRPTEIEADPGRERKQQLEELKFSDPKLREYVCYVLLDFAKADPELDDMPLAAALELSRELELDTQFEKLAAKEFKMRVRDVRKLKEQAGELLAKAEASGG